jgi:hypothetical protein
MRILKKPPLSLPPPPMMTKTTHDFYYSFGNVVVATLKLIVEAIAVGIIFSNQISFCPERLEEAF